MEILNFKIENSLSNKVFLAFLFCINVKNISRKIITVSAKYHVIAVAKKKLDSIIMLILHDSNNMFADFIAFFPIFSSLILWLCILNWLIG